MAIFQSLANALKVLAVGDRVKVTLRPETGAFPNPMDGRIAEKDEAGNLSLNSERGVVGIRAEDIISITKLPG
jgi:hypothetical protein